MGANAGASSQRGRGGPNGGRPNSKQQTGDQRGDETGDHKWAGDAGGNAGASSDSPLRRGLIKRQGLNGRRVLDICGVLCVVALHR